MGVTTVSQVINAVKTTLQETTQDGTRWRNSELLGYLNEAYQDIVRLNPDANAKNEEITCVAGTKQSIPATGLRLLDVIRNITPSKRAISSVPRRQLDSTIPEWHGSEVSVGKGVEHYTFDAIDPKNFYVYPGATIENEAAGTTNILIEIIYSAVPIAHMIDGEAIPEDVVNIDDVYVPAVKNYIIHRAYDKDAEFSGNAEKANNYYQRYLQALGNKQQIDMATSPNQKANQGL
jgi:hypothetical protein